ncbi:MAG: calcium-binding protein [Methylophilaceae bacterium 17-44-8]|nr:MAG: calcium-binding protein [Methylophilaceae bacterium 17-44-8]
MNALSTLIAATLLVATTQTLAADPMLSTGGYATQLQKLEMMKMLDADGNHMVTATEADTYYNNVFDALNKDKDNTLDAKEWAGPSKQSKLDLATGGYSRELRSMKMMEMMDTDKNHEVTREEFLNHHRAVFVQLDTSADQQIDAQEWVAKVFAGQ